jgi:hypothetical protein
MCSSPNAYRAYIGFFFDRGDVEPLDDLDSCPLCFPEQDGVENGAGDPERRGRSDRRLVVR